MRAQAKFYFLIISHISGWFTTTSVKSSKHTSPLSDAYAIQYLILNIPINCFWIMLKYNRIHGFVKNTFEAIYFKKRKLIFLP